MSKVLGNYFFSKRRQAQDYVESWQSAIYSMVVFGATMIVIFWASVFLYTSFYFTFMPQESITWPIHFQFRTCGNEPGICSNPSAVIPVLDPTRGSLLVRGQKYRVVVDLEMPESPVNQQIGMFLLNIEMKNQAGKILRQSSRSSMLRYKSELLHAISTMVFAPFLLYGLHEEKQVLTVELFSQYEEDPLLPLSEVHIELASHHIELYSAQMRIHAVFSGLRYFMYNYPLSAAGVGIGICMVFLSTMVILSWYQFSSPTLSPQLTSRSMVSVPNGSASPVTAHSISTSNKLAEDESIGLSSDAEADEKCSNHKILNKPSSTNDIELRRDFCVTGTVDHEDLKMVNSSEGQEVTITQDTSFPTQRQSIIDEEESAVRQRIQTIH